MVYAYDWKKTDIDLNMLSRATQSLRSGAADRYRVHLRLWATTAELNKGSRCFMQGSPGQWDGWCKQAVGPPQEWLFAGRNEWTACLNPKVDKLTVN